MGSETLHSGERDGNKSERYPRPQLLTPYVAPKTDLEKTLARKSGLKYLVDMHIEVDRDMPVWKAHQLGHVVKDEILRITPEVQDVLIHIEPHGGEGDKVTK